MRFYKIISGGYIVGIGNGSGFTEISETEYNELLAIIQSKPTAPTGFGYRLTTSLEWEQYELPPVEVDDTATEQDYLAALADLGVAL